MCPTGHCRISTHHTAWLCRRMLKGTHHECAPIVQQLHFCECSHQLLLTGSLNNDKNQTSLKKNSSSSAFARHDSQPAFMPDYQVSKLIVGCSHKLYSCTPCKM
jgi:hypothetical protein